jgi:hypothetical protein
MIQLIFKLILETRRLQLPYRCHQRNLSNYSASLQRIGYTDIRP